VIRKLVFWSVGCVLLSAFVGAVYLWSKSYERPEQLVVRVSRPGVAVLTTDRGRLGLLLLGDRPMGERWVFEHRVNVKPSPDSPRLDALCRDHLWGFGLDKAVSVSGPEQPAVAGMLPAMAGGEARRVVVPFWALAAGAFGMWLVWVLWYGVPLYRATRGVCRRCAYKVEDCSHFCPKCGKAISRRTWSGETRPRRRMAV